MLVKLISLNNILSIPKTELRKDHGNVNEKDTTEIPLFIYICSRIFDITAFQLFLTK
jgi:hypothetical protein